MQIHDSVLGKISFPEPVLQELIKSRALQRLKGVSQIGANQFFAGGNFSRFEHSIGVCGLLKRYNASLEEQIMGLIHDVSHPAFSHVADYVFGFEKNQDFHETVFEKLVSESDMPMILSRNGYSAESFLDANKFTMLERELPDLCADRLDYFLRHLVLDYKQQEAAANFLSAIKFEKDIGFFAESPEIALEMAQWFSRENSEIFSDIKMVAASRLLAKTIKLALNAKELSENDIFQTDEWVLKKLKNSKNLEVKKYVSRFFGNWQVIEDKENFDFEAKTKHRYIDPLIRIKSDQFKRLSEVNTEFKKTLALEKKNCQKSRVIRIVES